MTWAEVGCLTDWATQAPLKGHFQNVQSKLHYVNHGDCNFRQGMGCQLFMKSENLLFCEAEGERCERRGNKKVSKLWSSMYLWPIPRWKKRTLGGNWIMGTPSRIEMWVHIRVGECQQQVPCNHTVGISANRKWGKGSRCSAYRWLCDTQWKGRTWLVLLLRTFKKHPEELHRKKLHVPGINMLLYIQFREKQAWKTALVQKLSKTGC